MEIRKDTECKSRLLQLTFDDLEEGEVFLLGPDADFGLDYILKGANGGFTFLRDGSGDKVGKCSYLQGDSKVKRVLGYYLVIEKEK